MKLLQVLYSGKGGHGSVVRSLITADTSRIFDHRLIYFGIEQLDEGYRKFCEREQIPFHKILKKKGTHLESWRSYLRTLRKEEPEVILLHSMTLIVPSLWYALFRRTRVIAVEHQSNQAKRRSEWLWSLLALLFARKMVCLTETYAAEIRRKFGFLAGKSRLAVIPNGIDTNYFTPEPVAKTGTFRIGMASRINALRDHATLIAAFEKLDEHYGELHIAGDGEGMGLLKEAVSRSKASSRIFLHGNLEEADLLGFLQKLQIYVHSTHAETLSTSVLQAMSVGLPVIVSDIPGTRSMFEENVEGMFFESGNAGELASKLSDFQFDAIRREQLGIKAREKCCRDYSSDAMFEKYRKMIEKLH